MNYWVYILCCSDGTLYTGITTDLERRVAEHNGINDKGAKYTRTRRPVEVVYSAECADRSEATKEEMRIKKLSRKEKDVLINEL